MKKSNGYLAAVLVLAAATMSWAAGSDPLPEAYQTLKEGVAAQAANLREAAAAPKKAPQPAAGPDYCVVYRDSGAEGMPEFFNFSCTNGVRIPFMRRWCWTSSCLQSFADDMKALMRGQGYEPLASFSFQAPPQASFGYAVFQKGRSAGAEKERYCLAVGFPAYGPIASQVSYRIDCADGAVTELKIVEPDNGTSALVRYMADRNSELASGGFEKTRAGIPVLFRQKARP